MDGSEKIRIQKIIAEAGIASRRKAEELITGGAVTVNGKRASVQSWVTRPTPAGTRSL